MAEMVVLVTVVVAVSLGGIVVMTLDGGCGVVGSC